MRFWGVCVCIVLCFLGEQLPLLFPQSVMTSVCWAKGEDNLDVKDEVLSRHDENSHWERNKKRNLLGEDGNVLTFNGDEEDVLNFEKSETSPSLGLAWGNFFRAVAIVVTSLIGLLFVSSVLRKNQFRRSPSGLLEVLEDLRLDSKHEIISLRWGERIVLMAKSGDRLVLLSELSDDEDVRCYLEKLDFLKSQGSPRNIDLSKHFLSMIREKFNR